MREQGIRSSDIKRVVVRGVNWVGDMVMTVPALRELRRILPGAHITLATRRSAEAIFADADFLDDLIVYERRPRDLHLVVRQTRAWRKRRFDLAVLFQNAFEAALIAAAARVPLRLGYATDNRRLLLTHALPVPAWRGQRHEVFYYLNIVHQLEGLLAGTFRPHATIEPPSPRFDLDVSVARQAEARTLLHSRGRRADQPLVVLCPGSINSRAKRWPTNRFAMLADQLIEEAGAAVALIGAPEELEVTREVAAQMRHHAVTLTGSISFRQTIAVLSVADLLITNDTGPAHIAAALNRPTLVIFGPTDPTTTRPFSSVAEIIRRPPACAPCMLRDCPIDHRCMTAIMPAEVFARALALMQLGVAR